ncbi:TD and POZ domain-containing protein 1-like [Copidosoma floridanum]|uniref:TD and POZ domain-containing protein 1-like n=1 Tax=Copidosoma floridanum TaxID=29053 RepID=UPI0006C9DDFC|nr:TD and POZ domain-containing protein 1-like [Copidosoma floridanum]
MELITETPQLSKTAYSWKIEGFSLYQKNLGEYLESQKFEVPDLGTSQCSFRIYPFGISDTESNYISIFAEWNIYHENFIPKFSVWGLGPNQWFMRVYPFGYTSPNEGLSMFLEWSVFDKADIPVTCTFSIYEENEDLLGKREIVVRDEIQHLKSECICKFVVSSDTMITLRQGDLFVRCNIEWSAKIHNELNTFCNTSCQLSNDFSKLLEEGTFSDIVLVSNDGTEFPSHRNVLGSRSSVFAAMLKHDMKENQERKIKIEDFNNYTVKSMLHYIYTNEFKTGECDVTKLLLVADKYAIEGLKQLSEISLSNSITTENVVDRFLFADFYRAETLKSRSVYFIIKHLKEVFDTVSFVNVTLLRPQFLKEIMKFMIYKTNSTEILKQIDFQLTSNFVTPSISLINTTRSSDDIASNSDGCSRNRGRSGTRSLSRSRSRSSSRSTINST